MLGTRGSSSAEREPVRERVRDCAAVASTASPSPRLQLGEPRAALQYLRSSSPRAPSPTRRATRATARRAARSSGVARRATSTDLVYGTTTTARVRRELRVARSSPGYASSVRTKRERRGAKAAETPPPTRRRPLGGGGARLRVELGGVPTSAVVLARARTGSSCAQAAAPRRRRRRRRSRRTTGPLGLDARVVPDVLGVVQSFAATTSAGRRRSRATSQPLAPAPPVLAAKLEVDRRDDDDRLVERRVSSQSAGGWLHTKASTAAAPPGPRYASRRRRRSACGAAPARLAQAKALPLLITRGRARARRAAAERLRARAPENECSSTGVAGPCASHSERKTSRPPRRRSRDVEVGAPKV